MNRTTSMTPATADDDYLQMIGNALDAALTRTEQPENQASIDVAQARYVIFSDLHKGARNGANQVYTFVGCHALTSLNIYF